MVRTKHCNLNHRHICRKHHCSLYLTVMCSFPICYLVLSIFTDIFHSSLVISLIRLLVLIANNNLISPNLLYLPILTFNKKLCITFFSSFLFFPFFPTWLFLDQRNRCSDLWPLCCGSLVVLIREIIGTLQLLSVHSCIPMIR